MFDSDFTTEQLVAEYERALRMTKLCEKHGESDGANAARAQARACEAELQERQGSGN